MFDGRRQHVVTLCAIQRSEPNNTKAPASPKHIGRVVCDVSKLRRPSEDYTTYTAYQSDSESTKSL